MSNLGLVLDMAFKSAGILATDEAISQQQHQQRQRQQQQQQQQQQLPYALNAKGDLLFVKDRKWTPYEYEENYQLYLKKLAEHLHPQVEEKARVSTTIQQP